MDNNGKESGKNWTKHIQVQYFFIKDCIENRDLSLKYWPTGEMVAYFFTKPLQGENFCRLRSMIQGILKRTLYIEMWCLRYIAKVTSNECVVQNSKQKQKIPTGRTGLHRNTCMYNNDVRNACTDDEDIMHQTKPTRVEPGEENVGKDWEGREKKGSATLVCYRKHSGREKVQQFSHNF